MDKNWEIFNNYTGWKPITKLTEDLESEEENK